MGVAAGIIAGGALAAGVAGGALSAYGTSQAQSSANKAAAQQAAAQNYQSFTNYLSSRGVNLQQVIASDPRGPDFWTGQYAIAKQQGDKDDFTTWLYRALQAAPSDPVWDRIANPTVGNGASNTTLPSWAVDANGQPLQPGLLQGLVQAYNGAQPIANQPIQNLATLDNIHQWLAANPDVVAGIQAQPNWDQYQGSIEQWVHDNIVNTEAGSGGGPFTDRLRSFLVDQQQKQNASNPFAINTQALSGQVASVNQNITNLLNGTTAAANQTALQPALDARTQAANLQQTLIDQQRAAAQNINQVQLSGLGDLLNTRITGAGSIYDASAAGAQGINAASLQGLANLLSARQQNAQNIYGATTQAASGLQTAQQQAAQGISDADLAGLAKLLGVQTSAAQNVFGAQQTGAQNIYGAQLLSADTYAQSAQQALQQQLAEQQANRARQGFIGTSSGSDLERARLMAQALQAGAGARAGAGVNLQQALAQAGIGLQQNLGTAQTSNSQAQLQDAINLATALGQANTGYASNVGNAGIARANQLGSANEQNSLGQLQSGVNLATALGQAGTQKATSIAGANEQNSTGILNANTQLATTNAGLLNANADIAKQNAAFQNAMDKLNISIQSQANQISGSSLPFANATNQLNLQAGQAGAPYQDINALLKSLQPFNINQASGPGLTTAPIGSVINGNQILGSALTSLGQGASSIGSSMQMGSLISTLGKLGTTTNSGSLGQSSIFTPTGYSTGNIQMGIPANATIIGGSG